jgi:small GTP-binding protein
MAADWLRGKLMKKNTTNYLTTLFATLVELLSKKLTLNETSIHTFYYWGEILHRHCQRQRMIPEQQLAILRLFISLMQQLTAAGYYNEELFCWHQTAHSLCEVIAEKENTPEIIKEIEGIKRQLQVLRGKFLTYQKQQKEWPTLPIHLTLPNEYQHLLLALDDYQSGLTHSATAEDSHFELQRLEASFLYQRCSPFLLATLQSTQELEQEKALTTAFHLAKRLVCSGFAVDALAWYFQLYRLDILNHWWDEILKRYGQLYLAIQANALNELEIDKPDWQRYSETLQGYRAHFNEQLALHPQALTEPLVQESLGPLAQFNHDLKNFVQQLWQESQDLLGQPCFESPDKKLETISFCVLILGSLSRGMATAYSDVEYALLVEHDEDADWEEAHPSHNPRAYYLKTLTEVFEFKVRSIGETGTGFHLDENSQPRTELAVRGTPYFIVEKCHAIEVAAKDGIVYSLLHADYLCGDEKLWSEYQAALQKAMLKKCSRLDADTCRPQLQKTVTPVPWHQYWACAQFKRNQEEYDKYFIAKKEVPDFKKPYSKLLTFMLLDLALYHGLPADNLKVAYHQLQQHHILPEHFLKAVYEALQKLMLVRSQLQLERQQQDDSACQQHQAALEAMQKKLLQPYFAALPLLTTQNSACFKQALWLTCLAQQLQQPSQCPIKLLEPTYWQQRYGLPEDWINKVFTQKGDIRRTSPDRNSAVFEFEDYCLKIIYPDAPSAEKQVEALKVFLAREYAIHQLSCLLNFNVTPSGCVVQLEWTQQGRTKQYYGWLCAKIVGRDLLNASQHKPRDIEKIAPQSYSALILLSLVAYFQDGQPRNFKIRPALLGEIHSWLFSIDNKRVFVNPFSPITGIQSLWSSEEELNIQTCLYLLPQYAELFAIEVIQNCQALDISQLQQSWLHALVAFDDITREIVGQLKKNTPYCFQQIAIEQMLVYALPLRLQHIIEKLSAQPLTHEALLRAFEPELAKRYEQFRQTLTIATFYQAFKNDYRLDDYQRGYSQRTAQFIRESQLQKKKLGADLIRMHPQIFQTIRWAELTPEAQYQLLMLIRGQSFTELKLAQCAILTDPLLADILKYCPKLQLLDISQCLQLTDQAFVSIKQHCSSLKRLEANYLPNLQNVIDKISVAGQMTINRGPLLLPELTHLSLINAAQLQKLELKVPRLSYVALANLTYLKHLYISGKDYHVDVRDWQEFGESQNALLKRGCHGNVKWILTNPSQIELRSKQIDYSSKEIDFLVKTASFPDQKEEEVFQYDYLIKIVLLGDADSGKTRFLHKFAPREFNRYSKYNATIAVDLKCKNLRLTGRNCRLQIWDTAGNKNFQIPSKVCKGTHVFLILFDVTEINPAMDDYFDSFYYHNSLYETDAIRILVGNKIDCPDRKISYSQGLALKEKFAAAEYFECSAKTGEGIEKIFITAAALSLHRPQSNRVQQEIPKVTSTKASPAPTISQSAAIPDSANKKSLNSLERINRDTSNEQPLSHYENLNLDQFSEDKLDEIKIMRAPKNFQLYDGKPSFWAFLPNAVGFPNCDYEKNDLLHHYLNGEYKYTNSSDNPGYHVKQISINQQPFIIRMFCYTPPITDATFFKRFGIQLILIIVPVDDETIFRLTVKKYADKALVYYIPAVVIGMNIERKKQDKRSISFEEAVALTKEWGIELYSECSAKTGEGVEEAFYRSFEYGIKKSGLWKRLGRSNQYQPSYSLIKNPLQSSNLEPIDEEKKGTFEKNTQLSHVPENFKEKEQSVDIYEKKKDQPVQKQLEIWLQKHHLMADDTIGAGDYFFDACAQVLNALSGGDEYDVKSLRLLCDDYAVALDSLWQENKATNWIAEQFTCMTEQGEIKIDWDKYHQYLANVQFTMEEKKQGLGLGDAQAIWGESYIDGRIISEKLGVKIHVLEINDEEMSSSEIRHQLIDGEKCITIEEADLDEADPRIIHLAVYHHHFFPLFSVNALTLTKTISTLNNDTPTPLVDESDEDRDEDKIYKKTERLIKKIIAPSLQAAYERNPYAEPGFDFAGDDTGIENTVAKFHLFNFHHFYTCSGPGFWQQPNPSLAQPDSDNHEIDSIRMSL